MRRRLGLFSLSIVVGLAANAHAERPPEDREQADYVVTGEVLRIFQRNEQHYREYVVQIAIEEVAKGEGYQPGDSIFAFVFRRKPDAPVMAAPSGHKAMPAEGQRIRAYIKHGNMEAIYPDWFEVVK